MAAKRKIRVREILPLKNIQADWRRDSGNEMRKRQCLLHKFVRWSQPDLFAVWFFVFPAYNQCLVFLILYKSCNVKFFLSNTPVLEWKFYHLCNFPSDYLELWHMWTTRSFHVDSPPHIDKFQFHLGASHSWKPACCHLMLPVHCEIRHFTV